METEATATVHTNADDGSEAFGIRPQWDYLLVRQPEHAERVRDGGVIIMPPSGSDKNEAEVVAVGPGRRIDGDKIAMPCRVGDRVVLATASYHPLHVDGQSFLLVKAGLVMAVVTNKDAILLNAQGKKPRTDYAAEWEASAD